MHHDAMNTFSQIKMDGVAEFDPKVPSIARVYDYFAGGKDNFAADREMADRLLAMYPPIADIVSENRAFLKRAVTWVAGLGISQFIDLGCGMPTSPNTHESARAIMPDARVVYLDNDLIVLSHLNALSPRDRPGLTVIDGDVHEVDKTLNIMTAALDLSAPACLIMGALLHFIPAETGRDLVARYAAALAPGSYVILTVAVAEGGPAGSAYDKYSQGTARLYNHSAADFGSFFDPLELVPPGVADARVWRPGWPTVPTPPKRAGWAYAGVGRVRRDG
jgi:hypothetical protein